MRPSGTPPATRRTPRTTPYVRAAPPRVDVKYRMAYVGTVSVVDAAGEALVTRRYAISSADDPAPLVGRMMADVGRARDQNPRLPVGVVQDAAPELWTLIRGGLTTAVPLRRWHEGIDRYHLNERLAEILRITEPDEPRRHQQLTRWNHALDTDDAAIDRIARWVAEQIRSPPVAFANDDTSARNSFRSESLGPGSSRLNSIVRPSGMASATRRTISAAAIAASGLSIILCCRSEPVTGILPATAARTASRARRS